MTTDPPPPSSGPPPPTPPPLPPNARPPVPGWLWLVFTVGVVAAGALLGALAGLSDGGSLRGLGQGMAGGAILGVCATPVFAGALALSGRFFTPVGARIAGTLLFACLLVVGLGAVAFAGCLCLVGNGAFR